MNIIEKRATNPAAQLDGTELVYLGQGGDDAVTTVQDIKDFATNGIVYIPNSTDPFPLTTKTLYMIGDYFTTAYGDLYLQLPPLTASTVIEIQLAFTVGQVGHVYLIPSGTDLVFGEGTPFDLKDLPLAPGCTTKLFFHSVGLGWVCQANYSAHLINPKISPSNASSFAVRHTIISEATRGLSIQIPDANVNLGTLPSVATAYGTLTAGQTRCQIIGGSGNTVGATAVDCILTGCTSVTAYGTRNQFNNCTNWVLDAAHAGTDNIFNRCTGELAQTMYVDSIGVTYNNCTQENLYGTPTDYGAQSPWTNYSTVEGSGVGGGERFTRQTARLYGGGVGQQTLLAKGATGNTSVWLGVRAVHKITIFGGDIGSGTYRVYAERLTIVSQGIIIGTYVIGTDLFDGPSTYTIAVTNTGVLTIRVTPNSAQNMQYTATVVSEYSPW